MIGQRTWNGALRGLEKIPEWLGYADRYMPSMISSASYPSSAANSFAPTSAVLSVLALEGFQTLSSVARLQVRAQRQRLVAERLRDRMIERKFYRSLHASERGLALAFDP